MCEFPAGCVATALPVLIDGKSQLRSGARCALPAETLTIAWKPSHGVNSEI